MLLQPYKLTNITKSMINGYSKKRRYKPKWIRFCRIFLIKDYKVEVCLSKLKSSKYIFLIKNEKKLKLRFSDHKPSKKQEDDRDSDVYVGPSNYGNIKTKEAVNIALYFFNDNDDYEVLWEKEKNMSRV